MKRISVLDFETSYQIQDKKKNPSPHNPNNFLVSYGLYNARDVLYKCLKHNTQQEDKDAIVILDETLHFNTDILVAFNAKFELSWLKAIGINYTGKIADPMLMAYVLARGQKWPMSLKELCKRYGVEEKSDIVDQYMKDNVSFENIPWDVVEEYGRQDVLSTLALYETLKKELDENPHLWPTVDLAHEFCLCLTDIEANGIKIDVNVLDELEKQYRLEFNELEIKLNKLVKTVMGDIPINLGSPEQLSWLLYSRKVKNKHIWKHLFNIGTELRGSVIKTKRPSKMKDKDFVDVVKTHTEIIYKAFSETCETCGGSGRVQKILISGLNSSKLHNCGTCLGSGIQFKTTNQVAGFKIIPKGAQEASIGGFSTDKQTIEELKTRTTGSAKTFVEAYTRYGALDTYLKTSIPQFRKTDLNNILHTSFMQHITATGRLSSQRPNMQNIPRGSTFEIKKAVVSRFKDGLILEADFSQLEFRVAGILSGNKQIAEDIKNKIDVHSVTAKFIGEDRQSAKPNTFKPLYGGRPEGESNPKKAEYYRYFIKRYDIDNWGWPEEVLEKGSYILPSGRELSFPNTRRLNNGYITNRTQIMNYKTQSYATADLVPIAVIYLWKLFKEYDLKSCIILTVHDSIEIDVSPDELDIVIKLVNEAMGSLEKECLRRYQHQLSIPIEWELKLGNNWFNMKEI